MSTVIRIALWESFFVAAVVTVFATTPAVATPVVERVEVVSGDAATGDGGNAWGGHQTRIARTRHGLFTAYTVAGTDKLARQWRLAQRSGTGWEIIASGPSGREPVNLLALPNGSLLVVAWPEGMPRLWTITFKDGKKTGIAEESVPGDWLKSFWPYNAAGIDLKGNLVVLQSTVSMAPGQFIWASTRGNKTPYTWHSEKSEFDFRHCYSYVLPGKKSAMTIISNRDVLWDTIGRKKPKETDFDFIFNGFKVWMRGQGDAAPLREVFAAEERSTDAFPHATCLARDAFEDSRGILHVLYFRSGETTQDKTVGRHVLLKKGVVLKEVALPQDIGGFPRMIEDRSGKLYLLDADAHLYTAKTTDGAEWGEQITLDFGGHPIEYSGMGLAVPRCGVPRSNVIEGVFPSGKESQWVYFRLRLK